ncbi:hypothetical protein LSCM1_00891 [Leishmania martiniquensis]|uniref:Uncharacterized protein n=1 Tax=Leishmania martiniquensis TaxID=1580590 RepID=A0A836KBZ9_9TRYP|nr:hypothetical protein LSCM1_00891 [Leishmania martiniquensis]
MDKGCEDANGSGRCHHKSNALRKFFHKSLSDRSMTPKTDDGSPIARGDSSSSPGSAREPEELEDHMLGSNFDKTELCIACGFPRGSSVCCPVTRRHHGTDEPMASGRHRSNHLRLHPASKGIFAKMRVKFPLSPVRHHHRSRRVGEESGSSTAGELHPLAQGVEDTVFNGADGHALRVGTPRMGGAGDPLSRENGIESFDNGFHAHPLSGIDVREAGDGVDGASSQDEGAAQYYCYTDENGYTYWYTQELQDPAQQEEFAASAEAAQMSEQATNLCCDAQTGHAGANFSLPAGSYMCEYVDENGQTVYCIYTPEVDGAQNSTGEAPLQTGNTNNDRAPSTSTTSVATPRIASTVSRDATTSFKHRTPAAFFASITGALKSRRSHRTRGHADPLSLSLREDMDTDPPAPMGTVTSETLTSPDNDVMHPYDNEVEEFMELLNESEKKRFLKERKRLIKELAASEKRERDALTKQRHDGMEVLGREERTEILALRNDQDIKTPHKRVGKA